MNLPELAVQLLYGRLAWGIVLAAALVGWWPRRFAPGRAGVLAITLAMLALQALPGAAAPAFHLALAMQLPSCLLVALCLGTLHRAAFGPPAAASAASLMPPKLALLLAGFGALLYLDAMGVSAMGQYYWGFGPKAAPLAGLLIAAGSALAIARGEARAVAWALLGATLAFALLRLPSGNLWDALLDPLLWIWSLVALVRYGHARFRRPPPPAFPI
jgi:MFS family permease